MAFINMMERKDFIVKKVMDNEKMGEWFLVAGYWPYRKKLKPTPKPKAELVVSGMALSVSSASVVFV